MDMDRFDWEFYTGEEAYVADELKEKARERLLALAEGQDDMIGAAVAVERPAQRESAYIYEARIVAYIRPDNVVAVQKGDSAETALDAALDAVERQVREMRDRLRKPWQEPHDDLEMP
ncbi:MAG: HPF/RaiA family ribosome-associated protein [Anaerolineae bacterium]|nr:HPF/RaiA family ribosome-associated protein [Anaerolineae bacterium]